MEGRRIPGEVERGGDFTNIQKGDREKVSNYRGITILNTAYKVYAMVLEKRLKAELEKNHIISETQAGFRSGRSTTDNIFILNYVTNREIQKKRREAVYLFRGPKRCIRQSGYSKTSEHHEEKGNK